LTASLPFVVQPNQHKPRRIGTPATGILEFPVLGGLTVAESASITEMVFSLASSFVKGAQAADAIAKEEGISLSEAFQLVERAISGAELEPAANEIRIKHAQRIEGLVRVYLLNEQEKARAQVTALIRHRLGNPEWSMDDTGSLPQDLFQGIYQLVCDELAAEGGTGEPPTVEDLGKPPQETGKHLKRTGARSTGI
jgi:hypothetical protein